MSKLSQVIAEKIAGDLKKFQGASLPSSQLLAERYEVSRHTIRKALQILKEKNLVESHQGRKARIKHKNGQLKIIPSSGTRQRVRDKIQRQIQSSRYQDGLTLPPLNVMARREGISIPTLRKVFQELAEAGVVYKWRNKWHAGGKLNGEGKTSTEKAILLIQPHVWYWHFLRQDRTRRFVESFTQQTRNQEINLIACNILDSPFLHKRAISFIATRQKIESAVKKHLPTLQGILIIGHSRGYPEFKKFLSCVLAYKLPVVWFDQGETKIENHVSDDNFLVCRIDEKGVAHKAVDHLTDCGHEWAGYFDIQNDAWIKARLEFMEQHIRRKKKNLQFVKSESCLRQLQTRLEPRLFQTQSGMKISKALSRVSRNFSLQPTDPISNFNRLTALQKQNPNHKHQGQLRSFLVLCCFLLDEKISVIVFPNDPIALKILPLIEDMNLSIPEDMNFLSFDNYFPPPLLPIDTIDFGTSILGSGAHSFLTGKEKKPNQKVLLPQPIVISHGSVKKPNS